MVDLQCDGLQNAIIATNLSFCDTNKTTPAEEEEQTTNSEVGITKEGVHNKVKPKRKVKRPTYLHDFV